MGQMIRDLLILATIVVYIVDVSGFTQSWRAGLARWLRVQTLRPLPPFDCGQCAVFWSCLIYTIATGTFSLSAILMSVLLSHFSLALGQVLILCSEIVLSALRKLEEWVC